MATEATTNSDVRCPGCGTREISDLYVDTLDREWVRYSVALSTDGVLEPDEHSKSLEVVGEEARVHGCGACGAEFKDESELHERARRSLPDGHEAALTAGDGAEVVVTIKRGLPGFHVEMTGEPATTAAVRTMRELTRSAIVNSGYEFPLRLIGVTIYAPTSSVQGYSVLVAAGILLASGQVDSLPEGSLLDGALNLDGTISGGSRSSLADLGEKESEEVAETDAGGTFSVKVSVNGDDQPTDEDMRTALLDGLARRDFDLESVEVTEE